MSEKGKGPLIQIKGSGQEELQTVNNILKTLSPEELKEVRECAGRIRILIARFGRTGSLALALVGAEKAAGL
jgi:hypothetical protein